MGVSYRRGWMHVDLAKRSLLLLLLPSKFIEDIDDGLKLMFK
jgi:hypothetical protein